MIKLDTQDKNKQLCLDKIEYLGTGAYHCHLQVKSNGFMYDHDYGFDNDEYFLAKAHELIETGTGAAELTELGTDSFIRFQPYGGDILLVSGMITSEGELTQSIDFAFTINQKTFAIFIKEFGKMVKTNT